MSIIKRTIKNNRILSHLYYLIHKKIITFLYKFFPILTSKYQYKKRTGKNLNLKQPQNFNEKLQWLKLYWQHPLVVQCTDKYEVRSYIENCGCKEILNQLYGVYENTSEINWDSLPKKFVLKATHGCGFNIICDDKKKFDKEDVFKNLDEWLHTDISIIAGELHYAKIKPRIICEKYIESASGYLPDDFKIYCFNGTAKLILVCSDRSGNLKLNFLNLNWEKLNIGSELFNKGEIPKKPKCLQDLIKYSEKLSKPFPFVRVDFYIFNGRPIFGELTFTPAGCMASYYNEEGLQLLGDMLALPERYNGQNDKKTNLSIS